METAIVTAQARSGSGAQSFTSTGFGTPQAAIIVSHSGVTLDTDVDNRLHCIGLWDGTNSAMIGGTNQHGLGSTDRSRNSTRSTHVVNVEYTNAATSRTATCASTTDGITLTWDAGTIQPWVQVILIKGITGAVAGVYTPPLTVDTSVNVTTTGINPNAVINLGGVVGTVNTSTTGAQFAVGFATSRDTITQGFVRSYHLGSALDAMNNQGEASSTYFGSSNSNTQTRYLELTAFGTAQFTVTARAAGGSSTNREQAFLALQLDVAPDVFMATAPTAAGDWSPYTGSFQPGAVLMVPSAITTLDSISSSGDSCGGAGFYSIDGADEEGFYFSDQDNVSTSNTSARRRNGLIVQGDEAGAPLFSASAPSFGGTGLTYPSANVSPGASGYRILGIAFPAAAVVYAVPSVEPLYYGASLLANKTGIRWRISAGHSSIDGETLGAGTTGTTDDFGVFQFPAAASYGDVSDQVTLHLYWEEGSDPVVDRSLIVKTTLVEDV